MVQINRGLLLEFAERRLCELEERLVVRPQRIGRHGCERFAQGALRLLEQLDPVGAHAALPVQLGGRADQPLGLFAGVRACLVQLMPPSFECRVELCDPLRDFVGARAGRRRLGLWSGRTLAQPSQPPAGEAAHGQTKGHSYEHRDGVHCVRLPGPWGVTAVPGSECDCDASHKCNRWGGRGDGSCATLKPARGQHKIYGSSVLPANDGAGDTLIRGLTR